MRMSKHSSLHLHIPQILSIHCFLATTPSQVKKKITVEPPPDLPLLRSVSMLGKPNPPVWCRSFGEKFTIYFPTNFPVHKTAFNTVLMKQSCKCTQNPESSESILRVGRFAFKQQLVHKHQRLRAWPFLSQIAPKIALAVKQQPSTLSAGSFLSAGLLLYCDVSEWTISSVKPPSTFSMSFSCASFFIQMSHS